jgi:predicted dehydrogenase
MKRVLIIGQGGIGKMYAELLVRNKFEVYTLDPNPEIPSTYKELSDIVFVKFDLAIICCPNYLHEQWLRDLLELGIGTNILVEKPGLEKSESWQHYVTKYPERRIMMVKNNYYREMNKQIRDLVRDQAENIDKITFNWINVNRVPNPGSWFTTKKLSWGGVSRDLMPHLLSIYANIFDLLPKNIKLNNEQRYSLKDVQTTTYGVISTVNPIYDVDDSSKAQWTAYILNKPIQVEFVAQWKSELPAPKVGAEIEFTNGSKVFFEYGFCPEKYYLKMINDIFDSTNDEYQKHVVIDTWIHKIIE